MSGNGSKGGVHYGTKGNRQLKFDNDSVRDANQIAKDYQKYGDKSKWPKDLSDTMKSRLKSGDNIVSHHCMAKDLSGIKLEVKMMNNNWRYNHIEEGKNSVKGLTKVIKSLTNSLKNPNLSNESRIFLKNKIQQYQYALDKLNEALEGE